MNNLHLLSTFILTKMFTKKRKNISLSSLLFSAISPVDFPVSATDSYSFLILELFSFLLLYHI